MTDYIDREAFLMYLRLFVHTAYSRKAKIKDSEIVKAVNDVPAADVRPVVRGEWILPTIIDGRSFKVPHCSVCEGVPCGVDENTHFCPNCGADMRKENE